jgi:hypothetical protein
VPSREYYRHPYRPAPGKGVAQSVRHLRVEALKVLASYTAGRIDGGLAMGAIEIIRIEVREILDRNLVLAQGGTRPPPIKLPGQPGRPRKIREQTGKRSVVRYDAQGYRIVRPYVFRDLQYWATRSPRLFKPMLDAETDMLEILKEGLP